MFIMHLVWQMTPAELYAFCMVIIAVIGLVKDFYDSRK